MFFNYPLDLFILFFCTGTERENPINTSMMQFEKGFIILNVCLQIFKFNYSNLTNNAPPPLNLKWIWFYVAFASQSSHYFFIKKNQWATPIRFSPFSYIFSLLQWLNWIKLQHARPVSDFQYQFTLKTKSDTNIIFSDGFK